MKKKWLALAITGALCLGMTGCNSDGKTEEAKSASGSETILADNKEAKEDNKEAVKSIKNDLTNPLWAFEMTING